MKDSSLERRLNATTVETAAWQRPVPPRVPALTVIAHPDWRRVGEVRKLSGDGGEVAVEISRLAPLFGGGLPLADPGLSRRPCLRIASLPGGSVTLARLSAAAVELGSEPLGDAVELAPDLLERGVVLTFSHRVALLLHRVELFPPAPRTRHGLLGESDALLRLCCDLEKAAMLPESVLLCGESGTGKELVAKALHEAGPRASQAFIAVNLAAIPAELAAAELFGVERGAFTGAERRRLGFFRQAEGGTLLLDEIGAAPLALQDLLLRALENGEIQPIGQEKTGQVDVRLVAATDLDLETAVAAGRFRAPLWHRLRSWEIRVPPLRERRDDVARLFHAFLAAELERLGAAGRAAEPAPGAAPWLPAGEVARLVAHDWPGNVRELRNLARRVAVGSHAEPAAIFDLGRRDAGAQAAAETADRPPQEGAKKTYRRPESVGDAELAGALRRHRWRIGAAAADLGVSRTALYVLIGRSPGLRKAGDLGAAELAEALARHGPAPDLRSLAAELEVSHRGLVLRLRELGLGPPAPGIPGG